MIFMSGSQMESDSNIVIRYAREEEWEPAMEIAWRTFLNFEADEYGEEGKKNFLDFISSEQLFQMFRLGSYRLAVAYQGEQMVGMASMRGTNHISLLFVDQNYHRRGIGTSLLAFLQDGLDQKAMTVNASPYGAPFYSKVGFVKTNDWVTADGITFLPMICNTQISGS